LSDSFKAATAPNGIVTHRQLKERGDRRQGRDRPQGRWTIKVDDRGRSMATWFAIEHRVIRNNSTT
jgi:hypothetical protein